MLQCVIFFGRARSLPIRAAIRMSIANIQAARSKALGVPRPLLLARAAMPGPRSDPGLMKLLSKQNMECDHATWERSRAIFVRPGS
jgi:hypothetical protein